MLDIRLLGQFALRLNGEPVEIPTRPAQSLFAYLVLHAGTGQRREKLAGLFWPDVDESNARSNLRHALWRIRKAIGQDGYLFSDDLTITFNAQSDYWLDTAVLQLPNTQSPHNLLSAVSVYTGDLLPGFYDDWVVTERERLQAVFEQRMVILLDKWVTEQQWTAVLEWGERWISLGHTPEPAYRGLMQAHAGLGNLGQVTAVYRRCTIALENELGVSPSAETYSLYQQIIRYNDLSRQTAKAATTNLPHQLTSFVGRQRQISDLLTFFTASPPHLVTLTGPGGGGKTRLALEVGTAALQSQIFPDGVWLVELAALTDAAQLEPVVASALRVSGNGRSLAEGLHTHQLLLILDNCEHLIAACAQLAHTLLTACSGLSILATSREPLQIPGERLYLVPSLSVPDPYEVEHETDLSYFEAVQLFYERAALVSPGFHHTPQIGTAVAQICYRLDGLPLAIELAAARIQTLQPQEIAERLNSAIRLLTGGSRTALPRQQTLYATIEWSYHLLSPTGQTLFRRLALFAGGWTLETAEVVSDQDSVLDLMEHLVQKSLVVVEPSNKPTRYYFLETIRQFAAQKLRESGEEPLLRPSYLAHFAETAERAAIGLSGSERPKWLHWITAEHHNLRAALSFATETNHPTAARLTTLMGQFWYTQALERAQNTLQRAFLLYNMGFLAWAQGDNAQAEKLHQEALVLGQAIDNPETQAKNLLGLARVAMAQNADEKARIFLTEIQTKNFALSPADHREYNRLFGNE